MNTGTQTNKNAQAKVKRRPDNGYAVLLPRRDPTSNTYTVATLGFFKQEKPGAPMVEEGGKSMEWLKQSPCASARQEVVLVPVNVEKAASMRHLPKSISIPLREGRVEDIPGALYLYQWIDRERKAQPETTTNDDDGRLDIDGITVETWGMPMDKETEERFCWTLRQFKKRHIDGSRFEDYPLTFRRLVNLPNISTPGEFKFRAFYFDGERHIPTVGVPSLMFRVGIG